MKTYIIYDSKLKDGLRKINDESITLAGNWDKKAADAAKRMGLTFTLTGRRALGLPVAKISGDKQKLIKYIEKWYDPDFFEDGYDVFDSKTKDSVVKDAIQLRDKIDLNALAREIRTKFKTKCVPNEKYNALECDLVWGNDKLDKQIVKYLKSKGIRVEWDSIGDDGFYYLEDSIRDSKLKDVRLEKGDWFVNKNDAMHADSLKLYKVIDDRNLSTNGFAKAMICEKYVARRNDDDDTYKFTIRKVGRETIHYDAYLKQNAVRFNSAEEALNWLRRQVKIRNTNKTRK